MREIGGNEPSSRAAELESYRQQIDGAFQASKSQEEELLPITELAAEPLSPATANNVYPRYLKALGDTLSALRKLELSVSLPKSNLATRVVRLLGAETDGIFLRNDPARTAGFSVLEDVPEGGPNLEWLRQKLAVLNAHRETIGPQWTRLSDELVTLVATHGTAYQRAKSSAERAAVNLELKRAWSPSHASCWQQLVGLLRRNAVRAIIDPKRRLYVCTDSSNRGTGITLYQYRNGRRYYVAVLSRRFAGSALRWSIGCREAYGFLAAARRFRNYFLFMDVAWVGDHKNLVYAEALESIHLQRVYAELMAVPSFRDGFRIHREGYQPELLMADVASREITAATALAQPESNVGLLVPPNGAADLDGSALDDLDGESVPPLTLLGVCSARVKEKEQQARQIADLHASIPVRAQELPTEPRLEKALPEANPHTTVFSEWALRIVAAQKAVGEERATQTTGEETTLGTLTEPYKKKEVSGLGTVLYFKGRIVVFNPPPDSDKQLVNDLLKLVHEPLHDSADASYTKLRLMGVHVQGARAACEQYVATCVCQYAHTPKEPRRVGELIIPLRHQPGEALMGDYMPLEITDRGNTAVFVLTDLATRMSWLTAVPSADSKAAAAALDHWRCEHGAPSLFLCDGGSTVAQGEVPKWCAQHHVKLDVGTAYNSKGRGAVEAVVGRVKKALFALLPPREKGLSDRNWDRHLGDVQLALNLSPQASRAGYAPLNLWRVGTPTPGELLGTLPARYRENDQDLLTLMEATSAFRRLAALGLGLHGVAAKIAYDEALEPYDPSTGAANPEVGEWILLHNPHRQGMDHWYTGPYVVLAVEHVRGTPTGFLTCAEVLGGLNPGDKGYPRVGSPVEVHIDRTWPFRHDRLTASFLHSRKLPPGMSVVSDIIDGPSKEGSKHGFGRFLVLWASGARTWEPISVLSHNVFYKRYCEAQELNPETGKPRRGKGGAPKRI